ncbi:DUF1963 domain-containing protein [Leptospira barantonii]|uniref:DUF1963 domain-containing protein n=1 Tax=Leptospira barantonii TaxID=2023184 RepID=A0ABX4NK91_9LEPT|nr:DUF1963 domain-containing protein [Leptospira barantonii]PJZ55383.1 hypothetical protein CH367_20595 [Leptospira barantonii]
MSNPISQAKKLVLNYPYPEGLLDKIPAEGTYYDGSSSIYFGDDEKVTPKILSKALSYYIDIDEKETTEEKIPLGSSKMKGLPHLPNTDFWPTGTYFFAQLNLADFKKYDIENLFPENGIFYIFDTVEGEFILKFYEGPIDKLKIVDYPNEDSLPETEYYLEEYRDVTYKLTFSPQFLFYVAGDAYDYRTISKSLPEDLYEKLGEILNAELSTWSSSLRIFGRPLFWQGEDEIMSDENFDEDEENEEDEPTQNGESGSYDEADSSLEENSEILIFHSEIGEGHFHVRIDRNDLKNKKFDKAYSTYSGT